MHHLSWIPGLLWLMIILFGCGEQPEECQQDGEGYFLLKSLDMEMKGEVTLYATLVETPASGASGCFFLKDNDQNIYRFEPSDKLWSEIKNWNEQLDMLRLGYVYRFVFDGSHPIYGIYGMKVFDEGSLLYLAASYLTDAMTPFASFEVTGLEGFEAEQLEESKCKSIKEEDEDGCVKLTTIWPVAFRYNYGHRTILYPTQEAMFTTPNGTYIVHLLHSNSVKSGNPGDCIIEGGHFYSFYIKKL